MFLGGHLMKYSFQKFFTQFFLVIWGLFAVTASYAGEFHFKDKVNQFLNYTLELPGNQKKEIKIVSVKYDDDNPYTKFITEHRDAVAAIEKFHALETKPESEISEKWLAEQLKENNLFYFVSEEEINHTPLLKAALDSIPNEYPYTMFQSNNKALQEKLKLKKLHGLEEGEHKPQVPIFPLYLKYFHSDFITALSEQNVAIRELMDLCLFAKQLKFPVNQPQQFFHQANSEEKIQTEQLNILQKFTFYSNDPDGPSITFEALLSQHKQQEDAFIKSIFKTITNELIYDGAEPPAAQNIEEERKSAEDKAEPVTPGEGIPHASEIIKAYADPGAPEQMAQKEALIIPVQPGNLSPRSQITQLVDVMKQESNDLREENANLKQQLIEQNQTFAAKEKGLQETIAQKDQEIQTLQQRLQKIKQNVMNLSEFFQKQQ